MSGWTPADAADVLEMLRWLEEQHQAAMREAARLLTEEARRPAPTTLEELRAEFLAGADVAAATARLETWGEVRAGIRSELRKAGIRT